MYQQQTALHAIEREQFDAAADRWIQKAEQTPESIDIKAGSKAVLTAIARGNLHQDLREKIRQEIEIMLDILFSLELTAEERKQVLDNAWAYIDAAQKEAIAVKS